MKRELLNTVFGSCPVNMSDEDILDAMKSILIAVIGSQKIHNSSNGNSGAF